MDSFWSGSPVVDRTQETFVEHVSVGGEQRRMEFTKPILWLQESDTQIRFMHGGKVFDKGSTYNDWHGYMRSIEAAQEEAVGIANHFNITVESSLELVLVTTVMQSPAIESEETIRENSQKPANYKRTYLSVPEKWRKEVVEDGQTTRPTLQPRVLAETVVWTSKNTPEQNTALAEQIREQWKVEKKEV